MAKIDSRSRRVFLKKRLASDEHMADGQRYIFFFKPHQYDILLISSRPPSRIVQPGDGATILNRQFRSYASNSRPMCMIHNKNCLERLPVLLEKPYCEEQTHVRRHAI